MLTLLAVIVLIIGVIVFYGSVDGSKNQRVGFCMFACGLLATLFQLGPIVGLWHR
jgi:hypothetical protein